MNQWPSGTLQGISVECRLEVDACAGAIKGSTKDSPRLQQVHIIPAFKESFLLSISNMHYVDVGLNSPGAYLTDHAVIKKIAEHLAPSVREIHIAIHGTPRQWCSSDCPWIRKEKDRLVQLLQEDPYDFITKDSNSCSVWRAETKI
ncbi:hypothetical protein QJS10_CPA10g00958 [Acorus calamus]|uniref:Uncharacterized protein n=1 Tax=Acorus calamus TaxID=4465 RepID=A0AAV9E3W6_ACOCL|nr:hypothetical protein QJS10_CPA10g00958 [Acorus calamus]